MHQLKIPKNLADEHSYAEDVLLGVLRSRLDGDMSRLRELWPSDPQLLSEVTTIGIANRLEAWLLSAVDDAGLRWPEPDCERLTRARHTTFARNAVGLRTTQLVSAALKAEGIKASFFKGPSAQYALYGNYFQRRSMDIDVLVRPFELNKTHAVLCELGYVIAPECRSRWWRTFLKEQHYRSPNANLSVIDLHTSVQQPGGPQPRKLERFLETDTCMIGSSKIDVPLPEYGLLISAISLYKALQHREPAGSHLIDLATASRRLTPDTWKNASAVADEQSLTNLLQFGMETAALLLGPGIASARSLRLGRYPLAKMALGLPVHPAQRISRTRLHWHVSESLPSFIMQTGWAQLSDSTRKIFNDNQKSNRLGSRHRQTSSIGGPSKS